MSALFFIIISILYKSPISFFINIFLLWHLQVKIRTAVLCLCGLRSMCRERRMYEKNRKNLVSSAQL